jgi:hypothetical protein
MAYIYIGQYQGFSLLSRYTKFFTWSKRSHSSAFRPPIEDRFGNVIEAWRKGVTEQHWTENHTPGTIIDVFRIPCTQRQMERFYWHMAAKKGAKYDFLGILSFGLRCNIGRANRWFCSEAIAHSAMLAGIPLLNAPPHKVFPGMLDMVPTMEFVRRLEVPKLIECLQGE